LVRTLLSAAANRAATAARIRSIKLTKTSPSWWAAYWVQYRGTGAILHGL
jgi:hypothetical protein